MNKSLLASIILSGAVLSGSVMAGTTASLTISGQINPPACDISTQSGTLSIANVKPEQLSADKYVALGALKTNVSVSCNGNSTFSIKVRDTSGNNAQPAGTKKGVAEVFSLGEDSNRKQLGFYTIDLLTLGSSVNSTVASTLWANVNDAGWEKLSGFNSISMTNAGVKDTLYDVSTGNRIPAKQKSYSLSITPWIAPVGESGSADSINLEGSASFELVYM